MRKRRGERYGREVEKDVIDAADLINRYGKRYAHEWYVRAQDENYLTFAKRYTDKKYRKITALAVTNAVITILLGFTLGVILLCR